MRHPVTIASTLLLVFSAISASAADKSVWDKCNQTRDTGRLHRRLHANRSGSR